MLSCGYNSDLRLVAFVISSESDLVLFTIRSRVRVWTTYCNTNFVINCDQLSLFLAGNTVIWLETEIKNKYKIRIWKMVTTKIWSFFKIYINFNCAIFSYAFVCIIFVKEKKKLFFFIFNLYTYKSSEREYLTKLLLKPILIFFVSISEESIMA